MPNNHGVSGVNHIAILEGSPHMFENANIEMEFGKPR
jgi:hypothetical protein